MKPRGRPSLRPNQETTPLRVRVPSELFDRLCREASTSGRSLSDVVRERLGFSSYKNRQAASSV